MDSAPPGTIAAEYLPDLSSLTSDQLATFRIGQIVRLTVVMERTLREIHAVLQGVDRDQLRAGPDGFSTLVCDVRRRLGAAEVLFWKSADTALTEIYDLYRERNRYVHDDLVTRDLETWERASLEHLVAPKYRKDVSRDALRDDMLAIVAAEWRLRGLLELVEAWRRAQNEGSVDKEADRVLDAWAAILRGEFVLTPAGGVRVTAEL